MAEIDSLNVNVPSSGEGAQKRRAPTEWFFPKIDRKKLKALMKRNNSRAFLSHGLWLCLLAVSGYLSVATFGTYWCILTFFVYGTLFATCNARWHESLHGTPFKTPVLNDIMFFIAATMEQRDIVFTRWSHITHHSYTIITEIDLEISSPRPVRLWKLLVDFINLKTGPFLVAALILHSLGIPLKKAKRVVPESEFQKMFWAARASLAVHVAVIVLAVVTRSWLPILLFTLPRFYGGALVYLFILTQHAGLAENVLDHRLNCRTLYLNPVFSFLYMHMEYHIEHHLIPNVPFHALPRLHKMIRSQLPRTYRGLWDAYKVMVPALLTQRHDTNYYLRRELPEPGPAL